MDNIAFADFVAPWRDDTAGYPLSKFIHEFNGPESEFADNKLRRAKARTQARGREVCAG
jgi:hypothetical protein